METHRFTLCLGVAMTIKERLREFAKRYTQYKDVIQNEEMTKHVLILPFLKVLGYDASNPFEIVPEFIADVGIKKGEKVDYAVMDAGNPILLIEVKSCGESLDNNGFTQLFRYFSVTRAKIAVLTNGCEYRFYSDTEKSNILDDEPFFIFRIDDFSDDDVGILEHFAKDVFDAEIAEQLRYEEKITDYFSEQLVSPSQVFIEFIMQNALHKTYREADNVKVSEAIKKTLISLAPGRETIKITLHDDPKTVTNHALVSFTFDGKTYKQASYIQMLLDVIKLLDEMKPGKLETLSSAEDWPQSYKLSVTPNELRKPVQIKENVFIQRDISASTVMKAIKKFFEEYEVSQKIFHAIIDSATY